MWGCLEGPTERPTGKRGAEAKIKLARPSEVPRLLFHRRATFFVQSRGAGRRRRPAAGPGAGGLAGASSPAPSLRGQTSGGKSVSEKRPEFPESPNHSPKRQAPPSLNFRGRVHTTDDDEFARRHVLAPLISQTRNPWGDSGAKEPQRSPGDKEAWLPIRLRVRFGLHSGSGAQPAPRSPRRWPRAQWSESPPFCPITHPSPLPAPQRH